MANLTTLSVIKNKRSVFNWQSMLGLFQFRSLYSLNHLFYLCLWTFFAGLLLLLWVKTIWLAIVPILYALSVITSLSPDKCILQYLVNSTSSCCQLLQAAILTWFSLLPGQSFLWTVRAFLIDVLLLLRHRETLNLSFLRFVVISFNDNLSFSVYVLYIQYTMKHVPYPV